MAFLALVLSGCATRPPDITPCSIVNVDVAECTPTDPDEDIFDKDLVEMLGYTCLSPKDLGEIKRFIREVTEESSFSPEIERMIRPGEKVVQGERQ